MLVLKQSKMFEKAGLAFEDFKKQMKIKVGSSFDKRDEPIFRNVFINGYMKALDDLVKMNKS